MPAEPHLDRDALAALQLARARALVDELAGRNPFWSPRLAAAGLGAGADVQALDDLARLAPVAKADLVADQEAHPPYGSNLTYPLDRYTRMHQTSGTTRAPLRWLDTTASWSAVLDCWDHVLAAAEVGPGDRVLAAFSFGPFLGFWSAFDAAVRRGCLVLPGGGMTSRQRVAAMIDHRATAMFCTPTYAIHLGEAARELGVAPGQVPLRAVIVAGEPGGSIPSTRRRIEEAWPGARVTDHHGMTEVGPVSFECPRRPGVLHVIESAYRLEVIDAAGAPAPAGELGELVLTTLVRTGSPLLRYRTGDLVRAPDGATCPCGRAEATLDGGIVGRVDDMVVVRGVNVFPSAVEEVVRGFVEVAEFRARVGGRAERAGDGDDAALRELRLEVEPAPSCADAAALAGALERALRDALSLRVPVTVVAPGELPRFEHKARRWVRE